MKTLTAIIILTIATTANATGKPEFPNGHDNRVEKKDKPVKPTNPTTQSTNVTQIANVESTTKVATVSKSKSTSVAKAEGGDASIGAMSFNFITPTGSTGLSFVNHDYSGMPQQAPAMGNSYINTSNSCDSASGLGFVFPGGGVNFSSTPEKRASANRIPHPRRLKPTRRSIRSRVNGMNTERNEGRVERTHRARVETGHPCIKK